MRGGQRPIRQRAKEGLKKFPGFSGLKKKNRAGFKSVMQKEKPAPGLKAGVRRAPPPPKGLGLLAAKRL